MSECKKQVEEKTDEVEMVEIQGERGEKKKKKEELDTDADFEERERNINTIKKILDKKGDDFNRPHPFRPTKQRIFAPISPARVRVTVNRDGSGEREVQILDEMKN